MSTRLPTGPGPRMSRRSRAPRRSSAASVLAVLLLVSCAHGARPVGAPGRNPGDGVTGEGALEQGDPRLEIAPGARPVRPLSERDLGFITSATQSGLFEVKLAELALSRPIGESDRTLARRLIADHTAELAALATLARWNHVLPPTTLDAVQDARVRALRKVHGQEFAHAFHDEQIALHDRSIAQFTSAAKASDDRYVRWFASSTLALLWEHRHDLVQPTAGAPTPPSDDDAPGLSPTSDRPEP